jgi:hypothetical protein
VSLEGIFNCTVPASIVAWIETMKNILVIDGAENCCYSVCLMDDQDFRVVFPGREQDIEFIEDLVRRVGKKRAGDIVLRSTVRRIPKRDAIGIHGTLFFGLRNRRKHFPNRRESDIEQPPFYEEPKRSASKKVIKRESGKRRNRGGTR